MKDGKNIPAQNQNSRDRITLKRSFIARRKAKVGNKWGISEEQLGKSERQILEAVFDNPTITISGLFERIGIGTTAIENNIRKLKEKGLLERVGSHNPCDYRILNIQP